MSKVDGICEVLKALTDREVKEGAQIALFINACPHHISHFHRECHFHRDMRSNEIDKKVDEVSDSPPSLSGDIYRISDELFNIGVEVVRKEREKKEAPSHINKRHISQRERKRKGEKGEVVTI